MTVIVLDEHRKVPGVLWWTGKVRCTECGHEHIAVAPMPEWAAAPGSLRCAACGKASALAVAVENAPCPT
jgi:hypothetical protein